MRWTPGGISTDVEDRRGSSGGGGFGFGRGPTIGCGGAVILLVLSLLTGKNFFAMFDGGTGGGGGGTTATTQTAAPTSESPQERQRLEFLSDALDDNQSTWEEVFKQEGIQYQRTKLVVYRDVTPTACGTGQAASGPFYCPGDGKVYLDLGFMDELDRRFGAPGDFAQAYVLAHEIGHHVQNLVGTSDKVHEAMQSDRRNANEYSVRLELQADCYAGIWASHAAKRGILEMGDVEEGLGAASAVGDDRIQEMSGRAVNPDGFTHGSAAQRMEWFQRGFKSGAIRDCDTFR
ncbi:MAG TPA: neutral zinc metallopeptidase [Thermoanaerobaculia bacterium]|jgi:predicted metalloprotease|nr:neutral zinc metallopeptidase [Thermoanaerobaculia bacterium]